MNIRLTSLSLLAAAAVGSFPALAQSAGDWTLGVGIHAVDPKANAGKLDATALGLGVLPSTRINSDIRPTFTGEYFIIDGLGLEVLAALPFQHKIKIDGLGKVGSTKQLPPVVSLQYHFNPPGKVNPFVGLGVNYTKFFHERTQGALAGTRLDLSSSWGLAGHAGIDIQLNERYALRLDARYIGIDSKVRVNGTKVGKVDVDPLVYGSALVVKF